MSPMPASSSIWVTATPAAPAPDTTTRNEASSRPTTRAALRSAAVTTMAVPCWSSWKTGMSSRSMSASLDLEAPGGADVLQVDPTERGSKADHGLDDLVHVGAGQADRDRVDAAELLEQQRLAFHHRKRRLRTDVPKPEHRGAVGDDRDDAVLPRVVMNQVRLGRDRQADLGYAGRVRGRQVDAVTQRDGRDDFDLAAEMQLEQRVAGQWVGCHSGSRESTDDMHVGIRGIAAPPPTWGGMGARPADVRGSPVARL